MREERGAAAARRGRGRGGNEEPAGERACGLASARAASRHVAGERPRARVEARRRERREGRSRDAGGRRRRRCFVSALGRYGAGAAPWGAGCRAALPRFPSAPRFAWGIVGPPPSPPLNPRRSGAAVARLPLPVPPLPLPLPPLSLRPRGAEAQRPLLSGGGRVRPSVRQRCRRGGDEARSALPYFCRRPPLRAALPLPELRPAPRYGAAGRRRSGPEVRCFPPSSGPARPEVRVGGGRVLSCMWGAGLDVSCLSTVPGCASAPLRGWGCAGSGTGPSCGDGAPCYPASVSLGLCGKPGRALPRSLRA